MFTAAIRNTIAPVSKTRWLDAIIVAALSLVAAIPVVAALYLVKSAAGINLMDGPSPLHDLLYGFSG
ncbi:MAG: hypothetical protein ACKVP4_03855 [Hyphomicrobium sp.]